MRQRKGRVETQVEAGLWTFECQLSISNSHKYLLLILFYAASYSVMVWHCLRQEVVENKAPFENCVSILQQVGYPSLYLSWSNKYMHQNLGSKYIGSNNLSQEIHQHYQRDVPSITYTFIHLFFLFSFLEDRLKDEAFRSLQDVIQGSSSHVLTCFWKGLPPIEANTRQGQAEEQQWQLDRQHCETGVPATSMGERTTGEEDGAKEFQQ